MIHIVTGAVNNTLAGDMMFARFAQKPLWKLISDISPVEVVQSTTFSYISDAIIPTQALAFLEEKAAVKAAMEMEMRLRGYLAYMTSTGWLGYSDEEIIQDESRC